MTTTRRLVSSSSLRVGFGRAVGGGEGFVRLCPLTRAASGRPVPAYRVFLAMGDKWVEDITCPRDVLLDWARAEGATLSADIKDSVEAIEAERPPFVGLRMDRPHVMGVLNVTPDSFSDGGDHRDVGAALAAGRRMRAGGASIIDVGGESTRPGALPPSEEEEIHRVMPVVSALAADGALVSVDTRRPQVMRAAVKAGARIINTIDALREPGALETAADLGVAVILSHMRGQPQTMQQDPAYGCAPLDVFNELRARVDDCLAAGIAGADIGVDPGIGFGKTIDHNLQILNSLGLYHGLVCPLVLGASRKGFIGVITSESSPKERLAGSIACAQIGWEAGVHVVRVHDVAETAQAMAVWRAVAEKRQR